jgi:hypothetical protein
MRWGNRAFPADYNIGGSNNRGLFVNPIAYQKEPGATALLGSSKEAFLPHSSCRPPRADCGRRTGKTRGRPPYAIRPGMLSGAATSYITGWSDPPTVVPLWGQ